jgi:hypothetical protein
MVNKTFNKSIPHEDFELMNEANVYEVKPKSQAINKWSRGNSEDSKSNDSYDNDEPPPPSKKQKSDFKSVITTSHEESNGHGARLCGSKSNADNLILRLFLYRFVHRMS